MAIQSNYHICPRCGRPRKTLVTSIRHLSWPDGLCWGCAEEVFAEEVEKADTLRRQEMAKMTPDEREAMKQQTLKELYG